MIKNYTKLGSFKIIMSLLSISTIFLQALSQEPLKIATVKYDENWSYSASSNGLITSDGAVWENKNLTNFLGLSLLGYTVYGKKENVREEIKEYSRSLNANPWTISQTDNIIKMTSGDLTVNLSEKNRLISINVANSLVVDKTKYKDYTEFEFKYDLIKNGGFHYPYSGFNKTEKIYFSSGMDFFSIPEGSKYNWDTQKKNVLSFNVFKKDFTIEHYIPGLDIIDPEKDLIMNKLISESSEVKVAAKGGYSKLTINRPLNCPKFADFKVNSIFNLNQNNEFHPSNVFLNEFSNTVSSSFSTVSVSTTNKDTEYNTFEYKQDNQKIKQKITVFGQDELWQNWTNQERLQNKTARFNLGEGENIINAGDIMYVLEFDNYILPETQITGNSTYGKSSFFQTTINVNFRNADNSDYEIIYPYVSLDADKADVNAKIVSVSIDQSDITFTHKFDRIKGKGQFITITTTAFSGHAAIRILFKFVDGNPTPFVLDDKSIANEKLVFRNYGGVFSFFDKAWNINDKAGADLAEIANIRFDSIEEFSAKSTSIRKFSTKRLFFDTSTITEIGGRNMNYNLYAAKSRYVNENTNVDITLYYGLNDSNVLYKYYDKDQKIQEEKIILNQGEVLVKFHIYRYSPCLNNAEKKLPFGCNEESDIVSLRFYLDEKTLGYDDEKPVVNNPKVMRILQPTPAPSDKKVLSINARNLPGNYEKFEKTSIDNLPDFAEDILRFDYKSSSNKPSLTGGFIIKYTRKMPTPSGNTLIYIIIIVIALGLIILLAGCAMRRNKLRKQSEDARRLNDNSN